MRGAMFLDYKQKLIRAGPAAGRFRGLFKIPLRFVLLQFRHCTSGMGFELVLVNGGFRTVVLAIRRFERGMGRTS